MFTCASRKTRPSVQKSILDYFVRGQPCSMCKDQCPGFLVHRWRAILRLYPMEIQFLFLLLVAEVLCLPVSFFQFFWL